MGHVKIKTIRNVIFCSIVFLFIAPIINISVTLLLDRLLLPTRTALPNVEIITRIKIQQVYMGENSKVWVAFDTKTYENIYEIMSALPRVRREIPLASANHNTPMIEGVMSYLVIQIYGQANDREVLMRKLSLYTSNGREYIWDAYVGIFIICQEKSDIIRQIYIRNIKYLLY